ncbi:hypothetical protein [Peribacillus simplex]|nr:hypothetical protein [Peribacillus simplex]
MITLKDLRVGKKPQGCGWLLFFLLGASFKKESRAQPFNMAVIN